MVPEGGSTREGARGWPHLVAHQVVAQLAVGQAPHLHGLVPARRHDDGVLQSAIVDGREGKCMSRLQSAGACLGPQAEDTTARKQARPGQAPAVLIPRHTASAGCFSHPQPALPQHLLATVAATAACLGDGGEAHARHPLGVAIGLANGVLALACGEANGVECTPGVEQAARIVQAGGQAGCAQLRDGTPPVLSQQRRTPASARRTPARCAPHPGCSTA